MTSRFLNIILFIFIIKLLTKSLLLDTDSNYGGKGAKYNFLYFPESANVSIMGKKLSKLGHHIVDIIIGKKLTWFKKNKMSSIANSARKSFVRFSLSCWRAWRWRKVCLHRIKFTIRLWRKMGEWSEGTWSNWYSLYKIKTRKKSMS